MLKSEPVYLGRAKSFIGGGFALMAFVCALALGTASAPALGGLSWVMVTAGAAGVVYVTGAAAVTALVGLRSHEPPLRPATITTPGDRLRSSGR
jgi:uncharacterized membrane protein YdcZ (DUF606 family)